MGSLTLSGGFVFDATGSAPFRADVRVEDGRIAESARTWTATTASTRPAARSCRA